MYYLDAPEERASHAIMHQLGVTVTLVDNHHVESGSGAKAIPRELSAEHKSHADVSYKVASGQVFVELRDIADCWIRVVLNPGDSISLPAKLYRRMLSSPSTKQPAMILELSNATGVISRFTEEPDAVSVPTYHTYRELVCELCKQFFNAGWVTGTGGSISIRHGNRIYMTPSGVQKERILPDELYVLDIAGEVLSVPHRKPGCRQPKLSDCSPLFLHAFQQRNAGAVLHSHSFCTNLATSLFEGKSEFRISHQEMIKGIAGYGYFDELVIPIIENTAWEHELADSLGETIAKYPKACAVLVRRHGMYVWGDTWEAAKRHGECLHYLFELAIQMKKLGMDFNSPPLPLGSVDTSSSSASNGNSEKRSLTTDNDHATNKRPKVTNNANGASSYKYVIFDIEGTTTPITFVKDVLFPYASKHVENYLKTTWTTPLTQADVNELVNQASVDAKDSSLSGVPSVPPPSSNNKEDMISALVKYVQWCISKDRKIGALKQLQGHIWEAGYNSGEIKSLIYDDVPSYFQRLINAGSKIAIYSSGSREAQKLLFKHSNHGDLRPHISCYFDTKIGQKREENSYNEIVMSLGVDSPSQLLFITDVIEEAWAAQKVGIATVLSVRPGNAPLPVGHGLRTVTSFDEL